MIIAWTQGMAETAVQAGIVQHGWMAWTGFLVFIVLMLALDLGVLNRKAHVVSIREALVWSAFWIALALVFNVGVYFTLGATSATNFLQGYVVEKALSVDNLFVFLMIFGYFRVPHHYQHKVLFWGILMAIVLRGVCILIGAELIERFHFTMFLFGLILLWTGYKLLRGGDEPTYEPEKSFAMRLMRRYLPLAEEYDAGRFFTRLEGRLFATPLFVVLVIINVADVVFAVDSIPAIFGITQDPFIVFTSNIFAIFGLRALFFALAGMLRLFNYLNVGLSVILIYIGLKMIVAEAANHLAVHPSSYHIPEMFSLLIVLGILAVSVLASIAFPRGHLQVEHFSPPPGDAEPPVDVSPNAESATPTSTPTAGA